MKKYFGPALILGLALVMLESCGNPPSDGGVTHYTISKNEEGLIALHLNGGKDRNREYIFDSVFIYQYGNKDYKKPLHLGDTIPDWNFLVCSIDNEGIPKYGIVRSGEGVLAVEFDEIRSQYKRADQKTEPDLFHVRIDNKWGVYHLSSGIIMPFVDFDDFDGVSSLWGVSGYDPKTDELYDPEDITREDSHTYMYLGDSAVLFKKDGDVFVQVDDYDLISNLVMKHHRYNRAKPRRINGKIFFWVEWNKYSDQKMQGYVGVRHKEDILIPMDVYTYIQDHPTGGHVCFSKEGVTGYCDIEDWLVKTFPVDEKQPLEFVEFIYEDYVVVRDVKTRKLGIAKSNLQPVSEIIYGCIEKTADKSKFSLKKYFEDSSPMLIDLSEVMVMEE